MLSYEELIDLLKKRRSVRAFKSDPLPEGTVEKIIEAARWAPSGGDGQLWDFIVIRDRVLKEKIVKLFMKACEPTFRREQENDPDLRRTQMVLPVPEPKFKDAPAFILMTGDPRTKIAFPLRVKETKAEEVMVSGLATAFFCMHLAARSLGLGSQWVSAVADQTIEKDLKELLRIPDEAIIYDMMAVGYPAYDPGLRSPRPLEEIVHRETFQTEKYRNQQEIWNFVRKLRNPKG
jgi:5,6-dimethylbenzimidazole synthase